MHEMGVYDLPAVIDYVLNATGHNSLVYLGHTLGTTMMHVHIMHEMGVYDLPAVIDYVLNATDHNNLVHEMGVYDLPAVIDYVLNATGHNSLVYLGHSLGTTMMYVMSARRPEYVYKVRLMVGLAPAAFFGRYRAAVQRFFLESSSSYSAYFGRVGVHEVMPRTPLTAVMARLFCSSNSPTQQLCLQFFYFTAGLGSLSDFSHVNKTLLPEFVSHVPTGASPKTLSHLGQLSKSGRFCNYDYGSEENLARYGSSSPPDYDLSKTSMPVINFYGEGDTLVDSRDATELSAKLPNLIANIAVDNPLFNHMDFIWAEDATDLVYQRILEVIAKYPG
ncbi:hypothetical protein J6590_047277 [Homalodisca vitripennis]|nr:hypothetical protein J6590_047277 [Homalodisca vitripennis]